MTLTNILKRSGQSEPYRPEKIIPVSYTHLDVYKRQRQDRRQAWKDYYRLCCAGGSKGYFELLELAGLSNPFHAGSVAKAVCGVVEELLD